MKKLIVPIILGIIFFGAAFGGAFYYQKQQADKLNSQVKTIISATVEGMKAQGRVTPLTARFVSVVTAGHSGSGSTAGARLLVISGNFRYEFNLATIREQDVKWDEEGKALEVHVQPLQLVGPELDPANIREYTPTGGLVPVPDTKSILESAGRFEAEADLLRQAKVPALMQFARDAARATVERNFAAALRAAGIKASVGVVFADEVQHEGAGAEGSSEPAPAEADNAALQDNAAGGENHASGSTEEH